MNFERFPSCEGCGKPAARDVTGRPFCSACTSPDTQGDVTMFAMCTSCGKPSRWAIIDHENTARLEYCTACWEAHGQRQREKAWDEGHNAGWDDCNSLWSDSDPREMTTNPHAVPKDNPGEVE